MAELRAETRYAKQLFLYGAGDGVPIRSVPKLAEMAGVHVETVRRHLPEWEKESEALLASASANGLAIQLSAEKLADHESDMIHLRDSINRVKFEMDRLDEITARLTEWMDKFEDDSDRQVALTILDQWLRSCGQRSSLQSQFLALQKQWTSLVGIVDLKDIAVVREKEIQKGKAKLEMKRLENEPVRNVNPLDNNVFARPKIQSQDE